MLLNSHIDKTLLIAIKNKSYPISVAGNGIPCLVIGIGTLMQRTLSHRFKSHFKVYSSELYWDKRYRLDDPSSLTMQQMIDDIAELAKNLHLQDYVLFGHSAFGIVALEFAKQHPHLLKGIITVGTPLNSNPEVARSNNEYFEINADSKRKQIDAQRRAEFMKEDLSLLDLSSKFLRGHIWRDAPRYWHNPTFDCTPLWEDIILDDVINHFFSNILPKTDVRKGLETIQCPIFMAAGMSDYDCCPWVWSRIDNLPSKMTISRFLKSGHYPNYEEEALFDERIAAWVKKL